MLIQVYRYAGDKSGNTVVEPILSDAVLVDRGIHELNKNAQQKNQINASIVYRDDLKLGTLVSIPDPTNASPVKAKVTGVSFTLSNGEATQQLTLERDLI